jgi:hypothetical protein
MKLFSIFCILVFAYSCSNPIANKKGNNFSVIDSNHVVKNDVSKNQYEEKNYLDSIKNEVRKIKKKLTKADTIKYKFQLEDVGTEGNEGIAYYVGDSLKKIELDVYTSMWKYQIQYFLLKTNIDVIEKTYNISNESSSKIGLVKEITYSIDMNGKPIGNEGKERIDIFREFKKSVPFEIR